MKKSIYVNGIVKDSKNNVEKYLFSENERLNAIIDELEEKRKYDLCFISHLKKDKKQLIERIDKAIEYIENLPVMFYPDDFYEENHKEIEWNRKELLEILGDKE